MSSSSAKFVWLHESLTSPPLNSGGNTLAARSHVQIGKSKRRRGLGPSFPRSNSTNRIVQDGWRISEQTRGVEGTAGDNHDAPACVSAIEHPDIRNITIASDHSSSCDSVSPSEAASLVNEDIGSDALHPPSQPAQPAVPRSESAIRPKQWSDENRPFHHTPIHTLWPGISDACALPITVDKGVNRVLSFIRDVWFPTWIPNAETSVRSTLSITEWNCMTGCLENTSSAYSLLAMYATLLAKKTTDSQDLQYSLRYKHQSLISLRTQLAQENSKRREKKTIERSSEPSDSSSSLLLASMTFLLGAAIWTDNLAEAEMHLRALKQQYELNTMNGTTPTSGSEYTVIIRALRFDVRLAMLRQSPTIFDMKTQMPKLLRKVFERGDRFFETVPGAPFTCTLDPCLNEPLKSLILRSRQGFWMWKQTRLHMKTDDIVVLTNWIMGHHFIIQGRLLNFFLETTSQLSHADSLSPSQATETRVDLCLALGILCVHNDATNWGASGHESTVNLLEHLQGLLIKIQREEIKFTAQGSFKCDTILLWSLFIGTISARRHRSKALEAWFSRRLVASIGKMGFTKCEEVRSLLELFLYFEEMTPFLCLWFAKNIERHRP